MKYSLDEVLRTFAKFLHASWDGACEVARSLEQLDPTEFMSDWVQANWELLVETPFRELAGFGDAFLEPYGEGAECNEASSRVWKPEALPTHRIVCLPREAAPLLDMLTNRAIEVTGRPLVFDHFAIESARGWHEEAPPFDCALAYHDDQEVLIRLDQISFVAEEIGRPSP